MTLPHADFLLKRDPKGFMTFLFTKLKLKFERPNEENFFGESGAKVIEILDPIFQKTFPLHYQVSTDLMKFLKYYTGGNKEEEAYEKPKTTEVLSQNMELVQNKIDEVLNPQGQRPTGKLSYYLRNHLKN